MPTTNKPSANQQPGANRQPNVNGQASANRQPSVNRQASANAQAIAKARPSAAAKPAASAAPKPRAGANETPLWLTAAKLLIGACVLIGGVGFLLWFIDKENLAPESDLEKAKSSAAGSDWGIVNDSPLRSNR